MCTPLTRWAPFFYIAQSGRSRTTSVQQVMDVFQDMERPWLAQVQCRPWPHAFPPPSPSPTSLPRVPQKCNLCSYMAGVVLTCGANPQPTEQHPEHSCKWSAHASCAADAGMLFALPSMGQQVTANGHGDVDVDGATTSPLQAGQPVLQPRCLLHKGRGAATTGPTPGCSAAGRATPGTEVGEEEVGDGVLPARHTVAASLLRLVWPAPAAGEAGTLPPVAEAATIVQAQGAASKPTSPEPRRKPKTEAAEGMQGDEQAPGGHPGPTGHGPSPDPVPALSGTQQKAPGTAEEKKWPQPAPVVDTEMAHTSKQQDAGGGATKPSRTALPPALAPAPSRTPRRATLGKPAWRKERERQSPPRRAAAGRVRATRAGQGARQRKRTKGSASLKESPPASASSTAERPSEAPSSPPRRRRRGGGGSLLMLL